MMLNLNVPLNGMGKASTTRLGMRWYRDAITFNSTENDETATFTIGAARRRSHTSSTKRLRHSWQR